MYILLNFLCSALSPSISKGRSGSRFGQDPLAIALGIPAAATSASALRLAAADEPAAAASASALRLAPSDEPCVRDRFRSGPLLSARSRASPRFQVTTRVEAHFYVGVVRRLR